MALALSCCFAVFSIGAFAADSSPSGTATFTQSVSGSGSYSVDLGSSKAGSSGYYKLSSLVLVAPCAGTLTVSVSPCKATVSSTGNGVATSVTSSLSGTTATVTAVFSGPGSAGLVVSDSQLRQTSTFNFSLELVSWEPDGGGGGGDTPSDDHSGGTSIGSSSGGYDGWNSDGSFSGGQSVEGSSQKWEIHSNYIGQLEYYITDEVGSTPAIVYIAKNLANISHDSWSWKVNSDGSFTYVRPNPGSWLDNMWQMNIYFYYNLRNQKGWFGHINDEFDTLNSRVLQILSVLANDEDVKIKDATTDHRNWITDYFEDSTGSSGKPTTLDNSLINDNMNYIRGQFRSTYPVDHVPFIFAASSYDNTLWYTFWSQSVSDDVNGLSRGGMGGGRARVQSNDNPFRWADRYEYGDDTIVDMFGFGGSEDG